MRVLSDLLGEKGFASVASPDPGNVITV